MTRIKIISLFCLILSLSFSQGNASLEIPMRRHDLGESSKSKDATIDEHVCVALVKRYQAFQGQVGHGEKGWEERIPGLFEDSLKKFANGEVLVSKKSDLETQLKNINQTVGGWDIEEKKLIPSVDGKTCLIRYHLITKKGGAFDVMSLLEISPSGKISKIDEVYYKIPSS